MRQLKAMIDKRTKEKIAWIKECEDETLLSKKTSFSSFYNLEDGDKSAASTERKATVSRKRKRRSQGGRESKHQEALSTLLCSRPDTAASGGKRTQISKRLKQFPRKPSKTGNLLDGQKKDDVVHNIHVNGSGKLKLSRAFSTKQ